METNSETSTKPNVVETKILLKEKFVDNKELLIPKVVEINSGDSVRPTVVEIRALLKE